MLESIARLSVPDDSNMLIGIDPARLSSKSVVFGTMYGMGTGMGAASRNFKFLGQLMKSSQESIAKALAKTMTDLFPDSATRPKARIKNVTMQVHDKITYEIEIDEPFTGTEIEIGKATV